MYILFVSVSPETNIPLVIKYTFNISLFNKGKNKQMTILKLFIFLPKKKLKINKNVIGKISPLCYILSQKK